MAGDSWAAWFIMLTLRTQSHGHTVFTARWKGFCEDIAPKSNPHVTAAGAAASVTHARVEGALYLPFSGLRRCF